MSKYLLLLPFLFISFFHTSYAQKADMLRMEEGKMILHISTKITQLELDSLLKRANMMQLSIDSLRLKTLSKVYVADGWNISKFNKDHIELVKNIEKLKGQYDYIQAIDGVDIEQTMRLSTYYPDATFGVNSFKNNKSVIAMSNGYTRFLLYQYKNASQVYLSGSFNEWGTEAMPMIKTDSAWYCDVKLNAGKHLYKFIVNGEWKNDPENKLKESDTYSGNNSVYYECNYVFTLRGYNNAKKVVLAGTFNDWDERSLGMENRNGIWYLPVYLKQGTYAYKFIVDKVWITDPANKDVRDDGEGNTNSFISLGKPTPFELQGYAEAKEVILAGEFDEWGKGNIKLIKNSNNTWSCEYVLPPGNYQYKYIIDGRWYPENNLWKSVEPNYTFRLKGFANSKDVRVSGSFIAWNETGISLTKSDSDWFVQLHLNAGKQLYKFIVDGQWITDPDNPLHEENEYNTGNSFIWVK